jgi:imidazole glycerol phosphate synthase glutamine amidotransferase subunit
VTEVAVIDSGVANLASVRAAFQRLGAETTLTRDPAAVARAQRLVLPGVGAFGTGAAALALNGLDQELVGAVERRTPLLAICLGMQLLAKGSDEAPGVRGLGIFPETCRRLPRDVRVPHLGWNRVEPDGACRVVEPGDAAFANSYALGEAPAGVAVAWTEHGAPFVAAIELGRLLGCQFHPELSGTWGHALIERWLTDRERERGTLSSGRRGLSRRLVPCLDVREGRVVKGIRFQDLRDAGDPTDRAAEYERQGADEIVLLDVAATPKARDTQVETVRRVRSVLGIPLTVGGGVREVDDARRLLAAGADKVSVNTAAVRRPELLRELADAFGSQCIVLAIDARRSEAGWEVVVVGGREATGLEAVQWVQRGVELGAGEILLTSWDRDGTRAGCDEELIRAVAAAVHVPIIASGGIGSSRDAARAFTAGADAALAASIFHDGDETVSTVKAALVKRGIPVRQ